jgi:hypothetical protein
VTRFKQHGFHIYMTFFGFFPPFPTGTTAAQFTAIEKYVKYVVDRYGAEVDYWELMNEYPNPPAAIDDAWYQTVGDYLRQIDPYKHPISTSWPRGDLAVIDISAPHWYQRESDFESDTVTRDQIAIYEPLGKPSSSASRATATGTGTRPRRCACASAAGPRSSARRRSSSGTRAR